MTNEEFLESTDSYAIAYAECVYAWSGRGWDTVARTRNLVRAEVDAREKRLQTLLADKERLETENKQLKLERDTLLNAIRECVIH